MRAVPLRRLRTTAGGPRAAIEQPSAPPMLNFICRENNKVKVLFHFLSLHVTHSNVYGVLNFATGFELSQNLSKITAPRMEPTCSSTGNLVLVLRSDPTLDLRSTVPWQCLNMRLNIQEEKVALTLCVYKRHMDT